MYLADVDYETTVSLARGPHPWMADRTGWCEQRGTFPVAMDQLTMGIMGLYVFTGRMPHGDRCSCLCAGPSPSTGGCILRPGCWAPTAPSWTWRPPPGARA